MTATNSSSYATIRSLRSYDSLYHQLLPYLQEALISGQLSAFEFALIDEWYRASIKAEDYPSYGIVDGIAAEALNSTNSLRAGVYLRPIEVHNQLVDLEAQTGMNFYLEGHPWSGDKIDLW